MTNFSFLQKLGFTQYEASCYMALVANHPANGSKLSKISNIARSRIYDVLRNMMEKGYVVEVNKGLYAPLPPDELTQRLANGFEKNIKEFKGAVKKSSQKSNLEYIWTLTGYDNVMEKARQMIAGSTTEIYIRLFPQAYTQLEQNLREADNRKVKIRFIAMGEIPARFKVQVQHPEQGSLISTIGGRSFDIITDRQESLVGIFEPGNEDNSSISWTRNKWFVTANRDSLRHDFYHFFLKKTYDDNLPLSVKEKEIYDIIKKDN